MRKIILDKKGMISIHQIIYAIIFFIVVVSVLMFLFKADILKYLKNLPEFSVPEDEVADIEEIEKVEFSDIVEEPTDFKFGGGKSGGAGVERPFDPGQYEHLEIAIPNPINFVSDYAKVIPNDKENELNNLLSSLEKETGTEVAIVSMRSMEKGYKQIALDVFDKWGIGKEEENNGILIIFSTNDNTVRIEVGYGLEGILPDGKVGELIDTYLVDNLNNQEIGDSLVDIINAIKVELKK